MKKKNSFYNNKKRNQSWTEPETGRPIDFADKYIEGDDASDKYDYKREKKNNEAAKKARNKKNLQRLGAVALSLVILCTGYIIADIHIIRNESAAQRIAEQNEGNEGNLSEVTLSINALKVQSVSLDNSVMLASVIDEAEKSGCTAVVFDAKRDDGTVGYASELAAVDTYGAINAPATETKASVETLESNDIMPIARVCCYLDNTAAVSEETAIMSGESIYTDGDGNSYLNPDSELTYKYIKDIIQELSSFGVNIFILSGYTLPDDITDSYNDGYQALAEKLSKDLGGDIRLLQERPAYLSAKTDPSTYKELGKNQIYAVTTTLDGKTASERLRNAGVERYVIVS